MSNLRITYNQRLELENYIHRGLSLRRKGELLEIGHTTIFQEIKKNGGRKNYDPERADERTFYSKERSDRSGKRVKLLEDVETQNRVLEYLKKNLTPQIMVERAKKEGKPFPVSHQTIYNFIYSYRPEWISHLPYRKKKKWRWSKIKKTNVHAKKTNISLRDKSVELREDFGHYEIDTIHLDQGAILTLLERKTRFLLASVMKDLTTVNTNKHPNKHLCQMIQELGKKFGKVKSITSDNGVEFWGHQELQDRFSLK